MSILSFHMIILAAKGGWIVTTKKTTRVIKKITRVIKKITRASGRGSVQKAMFGTKLTPFCAVLKIQTCVEKMHLCPSPQKSLLLLNPAEHKASN
jgi:hypothetical protein